jgi:4-diphosphocytidyl-2-C-methyl-D-erythritol kinase
MERGMTFVEAPAKINLFLEVLDRRPDGYHDVRLVNQLVNLVDRIWFEPRGEGDDQIVVSGPFSSCVPEDPDANTVLRALALMRERWPEIPSLTIKLEKNIPVGAGLGGGSSDAAAVAMKVPENYLVEGHREDIIGCLGDVGSDMPFAAIGGTALVEGKGEKVTPVEFSFNSVHYLLLSPSIEVSTAWAYRALDEIADRPRRDPDRLCDALRRANYEGFARSVWNAFEAVVFAEYPELGALVSVMEEAGCDAAWMTGSGSNLLGLCRDEAAAGSVRKKLEDEVDCPVTVVRPYLGSSGEKD